MSNDAEPATPALAPASMEELAETLAYALRHDERGKPRRGGWEFAATLAGDHLAKQLLRSGFVILRARPGRSHSAG